MSFPAAQLVGLRSRPWNDSLANGARKYYRWICGGILTAMAGNIFWHLGDLSVRDFDEARYGVAASEMLHAHSLLVTTYAGETEFWNLKPPLGYWLLELAYRLAGENAWALRLPAALCGLLVAALTMGIARPAGGARIALLSGIMLATSFGFLGHHGARSGELDMQLTLLLTCLLSLDMRMFYSGPGRFAVGVMLSLAFLLKSFAALPFVAALMTAGFITYGRAAWRAWITPFAVVMLTVVIWATARSIADGSWDFVRVMFVEDLFLRSTTMIDAGTVSNWDYVGGLFDRLAPWPAVVLVAIVLNRKFATQRLSSEFATLLWCYALIPAALFTLARTHHFWYILPTYPAWAILAAAAVVELLEQAEHAKLTAPAAGLFAILLLACEARVLIHNATHDRMPLSQTFLMSLRASGTGTGKSLLTTFVPTYSERFFLQVVDGFELEEAPTADLDSFKRAAASGRPPSRLVLTRNDAQSPFQEASGAMGQSALAQSADYTLLGPEAERTVRGGRKW